MLELIASHLKNNASPKLDVLEELAVPTLLDDRQLAALDGDLQSADGEGAGIDDLLGVLGDVYEATAAVRPAELRDVDVAVLVGLGETEIGHVDPAATYWYLTGSPELLGLAAERLEAAYGVEP